MRQDYCSLLGSVNCLLIKMSHPVSDFETINLNDVTYDVLPNRNFNIPGIFPPLAEFTEAEFAKTHATSGIDATAMF